MREKEEKLQVLIKMNVIIIPTLINPPVIPPERKKTGFQSGAQKGYSGISSHFVTSIICDAPILLQVEPESRFSWIILHAFFRRAKASEDRERRATGKGAEQILFFC